MKIKKSIGEKAFDIFNIILLSLFAVITLYPFWYQICISLSTSNEAMKGGLFLLPREFTLDSYKYVLGSRFIWLSLKNSIFVTVAGTVLGVMISSSIAYPLSKKHLPGGKQITLFILITLLFDGGIIPTYIVIKATGLMNHLWALIVLGLANPFHVMVIRNFFSALPPSLEESAYIDGASPYRIFFSLIIPLSMPVIATVSLWQSVFLWNDFFRGVMFLNDRSLYILPVLLREIIKGQDIIAQEGQVIKTLTVTIVATTVVVALVPILMVYPFLQRFFVKGVMIGSVKG